MGRLAGFKYRQIVKRLKGINCLNLPLQVFCF